MVERQIQDSHPPRVSYRLTPKGKALRPTLGSIDEWAHRWGEL
jgi:DNA-binding HxlR family transcriptional regulator